MITNRRTNIINDRTEKYINLTNKRTIKYKNNYHGLRNNLKVMTTNYIDSNMKEIICALAVILLGILISIIFTNHIDDIQKNDTTCYIQEFIHLLKNDKGINKKAVCFEELKTNTIYIIALWLAGLTIIGIPISYFILCFKGFSLGYTISAIALALGKGKGALLIFFSIFFKNIIMIPALIAITISGVKIYKNIIMKKNQGNIKLEIIRHTITCIFVLIIFIIDALWNGYISTTIIEKTVKFL